MAKKKTKRKNLDEGMILIAPLLPVGGVHGLGGMRTKKDNFEFKGLPGQFNENGDKILDEQGEKLNEKAPKMHVNPWAGKVDGVIADVRTIAMNATKQRSRAALKKAIKALQTARDELKQEVDMDSI